VNSILGIVILYLLVMSLWLFLLMGYDKRRSRREAWRVKEKTLWVVAMFGGAVGGWIGMSMFRHKTKHRSFRFGFPALAVLHFTVAVYVAVRFYV
jgi:uncharacterized membrane protein YsdA (DUF1294 family)